MVELKIKISLKDVIVNIIQGLLVDFEFLLQKGVANLKRLIKSVVYQITFLLKFNYSKNNIKQHLLNKSARFFGVNLSDFQNETGKKRPKKRINNWSNQCAQKQKDKQKKPSFWKTKKKKHEKKPKNIYRPLV
mgnify:CR=1 FL=1